MADLFKGRALVVLDTETTGLLGDPDARVIELGAVLLGPDGQELDALETLVVPERWSAGAHFAAAVHGLERDQVEREGLSQDRAAEVFKRWLHGHGQPWVTAYNIPFDRGMLERMGVGELRWASCVMRRAVQVMGPAGGLVPRKRGGWRLPALGKAVQWFGVPVPGAAHRALADARMAAGVAVAIRRWELGLAGPEARAE